MKIKITLIAFLASAMMFTSCMKNESSPGIESVREAYASLLLAQAQAEVILANANASFLEAQAAVQLSQAAMNDALAALNAQEVTRLQAVLAQQLITWAAQNAAAELAAQIAMDNYEAAVIAAKNGLVTTYYNQYTAALTVMRAAQTAIFTKNAAILALGLDIANGTTNAMPGFIADLAAANAAMDALVAEFEVAKTLLGNVDAIEARIAELMDAGTVLGNEVATLTAELAECAPSYATEQAAAAATAATLATATADAAATAAAAVYATAVATFEATYPLPAWWVAATTAITVAEANLAAYDTTTAGVNWRTVRDDVAAGTTAVDALIAAQNAIIAQANIDAAAAAAEILVQQAIIDGFATATADALALDVAAQAAIDANAAAITALGVASAALQVDIDLANAETAIITPLRDQAVIDQTALGTGPGDPAWDAYEILIVGYNLTLTTNAANVILWAGEIAVNDANVVILTAAQAGLNATKAATLAAWNAAVAAEAAGIVAPGLEIIAQQAIIDQTVIDIAAADAEIIVQEAAKVVRIAWVAAQTLLIPDLYSTYLMTLTYLDELELALQEAIDAKEALRPQYETYMNEFFADFWAGLQAADVTAQAALVAAAAADATAQAALVAAMAPCTAIQTSITAKNAELAFGATILALYQNVATYNDGYLLAFENAIIAQQVLVDAAELAIANAEAAYAAGKVNYDNFMIEMASLEAELATAQALVATAQELLDAALAAL